MDELRTRPGRRKTSHEYPSVGFDESSPGNCDLNKDYGKNVRSGCSGLHVVLTGATVLVLVTAAFFSFGPASHTGDQHRATPKNLPQPPPARRKTDVTPTAKQETKQPPKQSPPPPGHVAGPNAPTEDDITRAVENRCRILSTEAACCQEDQQHICNWATDLGECVMHAKVESEHLVVSTCDGAPDAAEHEPEPLAHDESRMHPQELSEAEALAVAADVALSYCHTLSTEAACCQEDQQHICNWATDLDECVTHAKVESEHLVVSTCDKEQLMKKFHEQFIPPSPRPLVPPIPPRKEIDFSHATAVLAGDAGAASASGGTVSGQQRGGPVLEAALKMRESEATAQYLSGEHIHVPGINTSPGVVESSTTTAATGLPMMQQQQQQQQQQQLHVVPIVEQREHSVDEHHVTYVLKLRLVAGARSLYSLVATETSPITLPPAYQVETPFGTNFGGVASAMTGIKPEAEYDSWLTIDLIDGDEHDALGSVGFGLAFDHWSPSIGVEARDGGLFFMNPLKTTATAALIDEHGPTTVGQITVPKTFVGSAVMGMAGEMQDGQAWRDENIVFALGPYVDPDEARAHEVARRENAERHARQEAETARAWAEEREAAGTHYHDDSHDEGEPPLQHHEAEADIESYHGHHDHYVPINGGGGSVV